MLIQPRSVHKSQFSIGRWRACKSSSNTGNHTEILQWCKREHGNSTLIVTVQKGLG